MGFHGLRIDLHQVSGQLLFLDAVRKLFEFDSGLFHLSTQSLGPFLLSELRGLFEVVVDDVCNLKDRQRLSFKSLLLFDMDQVLRLCLLNALLDDSGLKQGLRKQLALVAAFQFGLVYQNWVRP